GDGDEPLGEAGGGGRPGALGVQQGEQGRAGAQPAQQGPAREAGPGGVGDDDHGWASPGDGLRYRNERVVASVTIRSRTVDSLRAKPADAAWAEARSASVSVRASAYRIHWVVKQRRTSSLAASRRPSSMALAKVT